MLMVTLIVKIKPYVFNYDLLQIVHNIESKPILVHCLLGKGLSPLIVVYSCHQAQYMGGLNISMGLHYLWLLCLYGLCCVWAFDFDHPTRLFYLLQYTSNGWLLCFICNVSGWLLYSSSTQSVIGREACWMLGRAPGSVYDLLSLSMDAVPHAGYPQGAMVRYLDEKSLGMDKVLYTHEYLAKRENICNPQNKLAKREKKRECTVFILDRAGTDWLCRLNLRSGEKY